MSKDKNIYTRISKSIDPAIYGIKILFYKNKKKGHEDIKKAISCLLFGGSSKTMSDSIKRRGDINILLLGDPSTAKSQLLKFVEKVSPIGIIIIIIRCLYKWKRIKCVIIIFKII
jgi:DNA replication licensing factor MCM5